MKNMFILLLSLMFVSLLSAQQEVRKLQAFNELSVSGGFDVNVYKGKPKAEITMIKGDIDEMVMEVKRGTLHISFENKKGWSGNRKAEIDLYAGDLSSIDVSAGASVDCDYTLKATDFEADASSGARISIDLECKNLEVDVSSGASMAIEGHSNTLDVDCSSGASYNGIRLVSKKVDADVSSGGSIKLWATESIDANASSGGTIKYKGDPKKRSIDAGKWSGGSIKKI